jgi:general secretion pathway protein N
LGWVVYDELVNPPHYVRTEALKVPVSKALPGLAKQIKFSMLPISNFRETVRRPLFSESRRPPSPEREVKTASPVRPPELKVMGIVFSPAMRIALVSPQDKKRRPKTKTLIMLNEGAEYEGWTVDKIAPKAVMFRQEDSQVNFEVDHR